jgi:NADH-quinone oxidoreductase subunit H
VPFWIDHVWAGANSGYWPFLWFMGKVMFFIFIFIWLRGTLPRLRYDQFMAFGWKRLIPISLVWIVAVAAIRAMSLEGGFDRRYILGAIGVVVVLFLVLMFVGEKQEEAAEAGSAPDREPAPFDAFAGGYPVPPMPGQATASASSRPVSSTATSDGSVE